MKCFCFRPQRVWTDRALFTGTCPSSASDFSGSFSFSPPFAPAAEGRGPSRLLWAQRRTKSLCSWRRRSHGAASEGVDGEVRLPPSLGWVKEPRRREKIFTLTGALSLNSPSFTLLRPRRRTSKRLQEVITTLR